MHELLRYQLKKIGYREGKFTELQLKKLFHVVSKAYTTAEENRKLWEDMLEISSKGMQTLYRTLKDNSKNKLAYSEEKYNRLISNLQPYYFFLYKEC